MGVRPLRRIIERDLEDRLAEKLLYRTQMLGHRARWGVSVYRSRSLPSASKKKTAAAVSAAAP